MKDKLVGTIDSNTNQFNGAGKELYIVSGGVGSKEVLLGSIRYGQIPEIAYQEKMTVPEYLWKVVLVLDAGTDIRDANTSNTTAFAVQVPNDVSIGGISWTQYIKPIAEIEQITGYKFFDNLSENIQAVIKNNTSLSYLPAPLMADSEDSSELFGKIFSVPSSQQGTREEQSVGQVSLVEKNIGEVIRTITSNIDIFGTSQISEGQINISQVNRTKINIPQCSPSQVSSIQNGLSQIGSSQIGSHQIGISQIGTSQITVPQLSDGSSSQTSFSEVEIVQTKVTQIESDQIGSSKILLTDSNQSLNLTKTRSGFLMNILPVLSVFPVSHFSDLSPVVSNIQNTTVPTWTEFLQSPTPFNLKIEIQDLPTGQLAEGTINGYDTNNRPNSGTLTLDIDGNSLGWFIDTTPDENSEFDQTLTTTAFRATTGAAAGKYDLLTTILHELGHLNGIIRGNSAFDTHVQNINGVSTFINGGITATLTPDGSHLDSTLYPYDLMNTSLKPGVRKLPSALNLAMIDAINAGIGSRESGVASTISAPLTAGALLAINNGDFSTTADWNTAGATNIINGTATLTEQSQKLSELTQAFIIPTGAKTLQFTILNNNLITGDTTKTANDAFEVALLDSNTFNPLAGTSIGLNHTDSLLNIQANGTIFHSDKVTITALGNNSSIVTIDLTQVTPSTQATLYFNLIGFGARTSTVTIDDVKLFTDTQPIPITNNDTLTTNQNTPLTLDPTQLTTNDTNVTQIQVINQPKHGTLTQTPDGKFTYQPIPTYVGNDSFTYLGFSPDGQISNLATVNITVNNVAPTIETILIPNQINEGQTVQLSATAKDGGSSDNLTYTWDLGDNSQPVIGQNITHRFVDNGTYNVVLTVTDKDGGTTQQSTQITVDNVAPTIVNIVKPVTIKEVAQKPVG